MLAGEYGSRVSNAQEVAPVVDAGNGVELGDGLSRNATGPEDAGIRDEQIEPAVAAHHLIETGRHRCIVGDVERNSDGPPCAELGSQGLSLASGEAGVDVGQHDVAAPGDEVGRDGMAKALGRTRDDDDEPTGPTGDRSSGGNAASIRFGLPALDELPLGLRQRADPAEAMRLDRHAGRIEEDLADRFGLPVGVAHREQSEPGHDHDRRHSRLRGGKFGHCAGQGIDHLVGAGALGHFQDHRERARIDDLVGSERAARRQLTSQFRTCE
jgi:hypothetical protein